MSDMVGVAGPAGPAGPVGNGRVQNGNPRAPQGPSQPPSGVRTPTDIMRQRRDREARRKAEQEARHREQEELERQQLEQEQQTQAHAQAQAQAQAQQYAAGVAADPAPQRRVRPQRAPRGPEVPTEARTVTAPGAAPTFATTAGPAPAGVQYQALPGGIDMSQQRPPQSSSQQNLGAAPQHARSQSAATGAGVTSGTTGFNKPSQGPPASQAGGSQTLQQPRRAAFPHAFERWETLSSHWEGLTSYWIRKLEQHNDDLEKDPLSQQLARQITDLSAAGANLFHAVVELQRLRASSERKFQRWFFDTRSEQERAKEVQADLERQLKTERQGRADAFAAAQTAEKDKTRAEDLLREMKRELNISKEEARRAWEELGRREQEERDRTTSLRNGEPTLVGGVQVVPMIQGVPSRHNTRPPTREGPYPGGPTATSMGTDFEGKPAEAQYYDETTPMSPTGSDPFIETQKNHPTDPSKAPYPSQRYEHDPNAPYSGPPTSEPDAHSYVGSSEAEEEYARYPGDSQHPFSYAGPPSEGSDEYEQSPVDDRHFVTDGAYSAATSSAPMHAPQPPTTADYSGSGWGAGTGWEAVTPRHRHPTRLSDVLEEDEPSRTSPSRASQASRSIL